MRRIAAILLLVVGVAAEPVLARRPRTLEDIYGDTGNRFQGAIGFQSREARAGTEARSGFGVAIDDVVLTWREFTLEEDQSDCASTGQCATINLQTNSLFEGRTRVGITVVDPSPQWPNDCDLDGILDGTRDCDGDGLDDVVVDVRSPQEVTGERVILNRTTGAVFAGSLALSSSYDMPDVLFVAADGNIVPTITATYRDLDDGTGQPCRNNVHPAAWGRITTTTSVFITPADVRVTRYSMRDNGDDDGWADDHETVDLRVEVRNASGIELTGLTLRATSNDPAIACITQPFLEFGDLTAGTARFSDQAFSFTVGEVSRVSPDDARSATLQISLDADQFQSALRPQSITFDLDLDAVGGTGPTTWFEGFESGFGRFVPMPIDDSLNPPDDDMGNLQYALIASDGFRCQYSDPGWENSASFGSSQAAVCFPAPNNAPDTFFFSVSNNRAFSGARSLYYGVELDPSLGFTTPTAQLEALRTETPIALGWDKICEDDRSTACSTAGDCPVLGEKVQACVPAQPTLTFKHQASQIDWRTVSAQFHRGPARGVVMGQFAAANGQPVGDWVKLVPYVNTYDSQANSNYFNCTFDPTDDGNTEDDFFDPTDLARYLGPSSTCAPEFSFIHSGDTGLPFAATNIGRATDGPGLQGSLGRGTWVESKIDLARFRGRRMNLRFLMTSLKLGAVIHWEQIFVFNPDPRDDGWWIDDVQVTDALTEPANLVADDKDNSGLPSCASGCEFVIPQVAARPAGSSAPGQVVTLDARGSDVPRCIDGVGQFLFAVDIDGDGTFSRRIDAVLRDWTDDATLLVTPQGKSTYIVGVRCGTETACRDFVTVSLDVTCPTGPAGLGSGSAFDAPFLGRSPPTLRALIFSDPVTLRWATSATVDVIRGDLDLVRANSGFSGSDAVTDCLVDNGVGARSVVDASLPPVGRTWFYLARSAERCNQKAGGSWGQVGEAAARDLPVILDPDACGE